MWNAAKFQVGDLIYWSNLAAYANGERRCEDVGLVVKRGPDEMEVLWLASDDGFYGLDELEDLDDRELFTQQEWDTLRVEK